MGEGHGNRPKTRVVEIHENEGSEYEDVNRNKI